MKLINRILVATDFSETSENVVDNAVEMAKVFGSEIGLVYVLPKDIGSEKANALLENFAKKQLDQLSKNIEAKGVKTLDPILENGDFSEKIIEVSEKINANFIFAGAGEKVKNGVAQLGSNAEKIIKKSFKPAFIVKNGVPLKISKILCPVDFSPESKRALKNAITLAHKFKAELVLLAVYEVSQLFPIRNKLKMDEHLEYLRTSCENDMEKFLKDVTLSGLEVTREIKEGDPASEILHAIKRHKADLLMMGTTGKSGISRILIGSVTEKVIREIPCSFITLKKEDAITLQLEASLRDIGHHYELAQKLFEDGFFEESIAEYNNCLNMNFMHIPSLQGMVEVYKKLENTNMENKYKSMIAQVFETMHLEKIETDIRKHR